MTARDLPYEILSLIAKSISESGKDYGPRVKLSPYALVNKAWQAAFEAEIYSTTWVRSPWRATSWSLDAVRSGKRRRD